MINEAVNHQLQIALNAFGTTQFDSCLPRSAVAEFLKYKDRQYREPLNSMPDVNLSQNF